MNLAILLFYDGYRTVPSVVLHDLNHALLSSTKEKRFSDEVGNPIVSTINSKLLRFCFQLTEKVLVVMMRDQNTGSTVKMCVESVFLLFIRRESIKIG